MVPPTVPKGPNTEPTIPPTVSPDTAAPAISGKFHPMSTNLNLS